MAEFICGSEGEFVRKMNERAQSLGMNNTNFLNCNGLDVDGHMTTAYDVALMSRELIIKYPDIHNYSTIWMENIIHETAKGSTEFGLTNTNKLIKQYPFATGLKTGSTSLAKYCVSATALQNDIELIAVVMAAPDYKIRFQDAVTMLNYGYSISQVYKDENKDALPVTPVQGGVTEQVGVAYKNEFSFLALSGENLGDIKKEIKLPEYVEAPLTKGEVIGQAVYMLGGKELGTVELICTESVDKATYKDFMKQTVDKFLL